MDKRKALVKYYNGRGHFGLSFAEIRDYAEPTLLYLAAQENTSVTNLKKKNIHQNNIFKFSKIFKVDI